MIQKGRKRSGSRGAGVQRRDKNGGDDGGAKAATPGLYPGEPQKNKIPRQGSVEALGSRARLGLEGPTGHQQVKMRVRCTHRGKKLGRRGATNPCIRDAPTHLWLSMQILALLCDLGQVPRPFCASSMKLD